MSDNLKLTTQEYVEKKLSAFTPGPSFKKIYEDDTSISIGANRGEWSSKTDVIGRDEVRLCSGDDIVGMWYNSLTLANDKVTMGSLGVNHFEASYAKIKLGRDSNTSIFVDGPAYFSNDIYDKNGNKIIGGGGGGSSASKVWQALFGDQAAAAWSIGANALRDNLRALGLSSAYLGGEYYGTSSNWAAAELKMFPMTLLFNSPITMEQLAAADPGLVLMAATPMQTP